MTDDERSTALGFYHYAHSYAASAQALSQVRVRATHDDAPVRFLFRHAVELYLKAFLRSKGVTISELASRALGHSTVRLLDRSLDLGLQVGQEDRTLVQALDDASSDRYLRTGVRRILSNEQAYGLCQRLHVEIGFPIYATENLKRALPTL